MQTPPLPFPLLLNLSQLNLPSKLALHIAKSNDQPLLTQLSTELDIVNHSLLLQTFSSLDFWDATNPQCSSYLTHHSLLASFDASSSVYTLCIFCVHFSVPEDSVFGWLYSQVYSPICHLHSNEGQIFSISLHLPPHFLLFIQFYISTWICNKCLILNKSMSEFLIPLT